MNTFQIVGAVLEEYQNKVIGTKRVDALTAQANEQISEIAQNRELYDGFLKQVNAPEPIDNIILWVLFMSHEDICCDYIEAFDKDFEEEIPLNDLGDLLVHIAQVQNVQMIELDGYDYLAKYNKEIMEEIDQHAVTNVLAYIQKSKHVEIEF